MTDTVRTAAFTYYHDIIAGTPYEAGRMQGMLFQQAGRKLFSFDPPDATHLLADLQNMYAEYCPGLNDELQGLADQLELPLKKVVFCGAVRAQHGGCAHFTALPGITRDQHVYVGRSYELELDFADLRLCTTRVEGRFQHLGFSEMLVGRNDGINERGLCVTMSRGGLDETPEGNYGINYSAAIRALLEACDGVQQALDMLRCMPIGTNTTFMLADKRGQAAMVEIAGRRRGMRRIDTRSERQYLLAVNHYTLPETVECNQPQSYMFTNSSTRYNAAEAWLREQSAAIDADSMQAFLEREYPNGFCGYSRDYRMGTLWSIVVDVSTGKLRARFGPPPNQWRQFTFAGKAGSTAYKAQFPA